EPNKTIEKINTLEFVQFLKNIQDDYQNSGEQLQVTLNKFAECYKAAKSKSTSRLWLVQVESAKQRKIEEHSYKQRLPAIKDKENSDPQIIPS
ncbi:8488_t:CDS:2, partial [Gigaspora rosea]